MQCSGRVLLNWSIFNPNGPTVNCLGFRETGAREELEVFFRSFHFLGGEDYCLGYVTAATREDGLLKAGASPRNMQCYAAGR